MPYTNNCYNSFQVQPGTKIFGATLATSILNRVGTQFLEVGNTRVLKNVGEATKPMEFHKSQFGPSTRIFNVLKDLWRTEGLKGYFRGLNSGIGLSLLRSGVFFPIYENGKFLLKFVRRNFEELFQFFWKLF